MISCKRAVRPGERIARCASSEAGWHLNPRFEGETPPPADRELHQSWCKCVERRGTMAPEPALESPEDITHDLVSHDHGEMPEHRA
jgi:hypothetical protein